MDEYISREDVLKKAKSSISVPTDNEWDCGYNTAMAEMQEFIKQLPSADVQPVNQWISVNDRLPNEDDCYLVVIESEICVSIDIAEYSENRWHKHDKVLYWQPLPEPPKDGDIKADIALKLIGEEENET